MFAVVEDYQELFCADGRRDAFGRHDARAEREAERGRHGGGDEVRVPERPELRDEHAVGKSR